MPSDFSWNFDNESLLFRLLDATAQGNEDNNVTTWEPTTMPTSAPTSPPTSMELVASTDSEIIRETFRLYGSLYLFFFVVFCVARKYFPKLYNIRSWVPEIQCDLAKNQQYGFVSWCWQVFQVSDDEILENCGMDALCFLRCLRLGSHLSLLGIFCSLFLIPMYLTAEESEETAYLTDIFVKMSTANLPNQSKRFIGVVVAIYIIVLYGMVLITKEYDWFIEYRHKFLSQPKPRNYGCYVSGILPDYRSSHALADYFKQCSANSAVLEAHIAVDTPSLDKMVARREVVVQKLEHVLALERKKGKRRTHMTFQIQNGVEGIKKVDSIDAYKTELSELNKKISLEIGEIQNANHPLRKHLVKNQGSSDVVQQIELSPTVDDYDNKERDVKDANGAIKLTLSAKTLSTVGTQDETMSSILQQPHLQNQASYSNHFKILPEELNKGSSFCETQARAGIPLQPLEEQQISLENLRTIPETKVIANEKSIMKETLRNDGSQQFETEMSATSTTPQHSDIPQHPFWSMLGLDASFFSPENVEEVTTRLHRSLSDPELSTSMARSVEDEVSLTMDDEILSRDDLDLGQITTDSVRSKRKEDPTTSDIEQGLTSNNLNLKGRSSFDDSTLMSTSNMDSLRSQSWSSGRRSVANIPQSVKRVGELGAQGVKTVSAGTMVVSSRVRSAIKEVNRDNVSASIKQVGTVGAQGFKTAGSLGVASVKRAAQTIQQAPDLGATIAATAAESAAGLVPVLLQKTDGVPRTAGFVVFNDLYSTQAARQMLHHPSASSMAVEPAGSPKSIFWRNVGLPSKARRTGLLLSVFATTCLCLFWSIPSAFLSSLTEVNSLKEKLPRLEDLIERFPSVEQFLALVAPLLLLLLNECILPTILKWFSAWEGHVSAAVLEASLFSKLAAFTIIQTFFVSTISGTISAEISNILDDPEMIVSLLANSLPAQSSYFIQVCLVFTFFLQGFDLIRAYPLGLAFGRRYVFGPKLTEKERRRTWKMFNSLEDPPEFWHAEILAQVMLFFVVYFVYATIAPISSWFLFGCFGICESGYRYHLIHNNHPYPDSGGRLWQSFIQVLMASMLIGELTLVGLLILKQAFYAVPTLAPLMAITILFMIFVIPKRNQAARNLPTMLCVEIDRKNAEEGNTVASFATLKYLQPSLTARPMYAEEEDC